MALAKAQACSRLLMCRHDFVGVNGHVIHGMYILPVAPGRSRLFYWHKAGSPGGASLDRLKALKAPFGAGKAQLQRLVAAAEKFFVAFERCKRHMYLHPIFEAVGGLLHGQVRTGAICLY
jgi:hypothetical protein